MSKFLMTNRGPRCGFAGSGRDSLLACLALVLGGTSPLTAQEFPNLRAPGVVQETQLQQLQGEDPRDQKPLPPEFVAMPGVEEEMEVIQRRSQLIITKANVTRTAISDPSVVDIVQFSPTEFALIGLQLGSTTLTMWFENNPEPLIYLIKTIRDPSLEERRRVDYGKLERKIQLLFPNSKVYLIPLSTKIIVKGQARDAEEAARILQIVRGEVINQEGSLFGPGSGYAAGGAGDAGWGGVGTGPGQRMGAGWGDWWSSYIVNMLDVPGEYQVMLRVKIAELNHSQLRRLGIDFNYLINGGRHAVGYALGGLPATLSGVFENGEVTALVNWLASNGTVKIMSEPALTVLSGHSASFLSGGEFAVPTIVGINGVGGQQTTFRGFGTSIIVTPMVIDRDLIRLRIVPEYSEINAQNTVGGIPGLNSRRVQTTVELREGQTIVLAGLYAHRSDVEVTRIPLLGDIPWVGPKLFSAKRATQDEKELLVIVTPELVRPMEPDEVPPVPGFYVTHPDDCQLYYHAMTEGSPDTEVYQLQPYGRGNGTGIPVGYRLFEPAPSSQNYTPQPTPAGGMGGPANNYMGPQQPLRPPMSMPPRTLQQEQKPGYGDPMNPNAPRTRRPVPEAAGPSAQYPGQFPGQYQGGVPAQYQGGVPAQYQQQMPNQRSAMTEQVPNGNVMPSGYQQNAPVQTPSKSRWLGGRKN